MQIKPVLPYAISQVYSTVAGMQQELILLRSANEAYVQAAVNLRAEIKTKDAIIETLKAPAENEE